MRISRPNSDEGKTVFWCFVGAILSWVIFGLCALFAKLVGCEPNEAGAGLCEIAGLNLMPSLSWLSVVSAVSAFLMAPVLLFVAAVSGVVCFFRGEW